MPFGIEPCERCANYFDVRNVWNIRPYNPNGEKEVYKAFDGTLKTRIKQQPIKLCKNCRQRIYDWINGLTRKLDVAPDKMHNQNIELFLYGEKENV